MQVIQGNFRIFIIILSACLFLTGSVSAAAVQAYLGDTIPLSGYSPTSNYVYLFLTGPNLPANGVALNDITKRADQGGFTVVQVNGMDDQWSYKWSTADLNGHLDAGIYTIWVVNGPNDLSSLQYADYGTISVILGEPSITANTQVQSGSLATQPGSLVISSIPNESSVVINGQYRGKTPLTLDTIDPGIYTVNISRFGYSPYSTTTTLRSGESAEITATLPAERGTLFVNTTPPGATISVDGNAAGMTPVTLANLVPGNHTVTIAKDGYIPEEQQIVITAGTTVPFIVVLSPSFPAIPSLPVKTSGLTPVTLLALSAVAATGFYLRQRSR